MRDFETALDLPPDYSEEFKKLVSQIGQSLSAVFHVPLEHDSDMNYNSSQKLVLWLDNQYRPVFPLSLSSSFQIRVLLSSRSKLYTVVLLSREASLRNDLDQLPEVRQQNWEMMNDPVSPSLEKCVDTIISILNPLGWDYLHGDVLKQTTKGYFTELDGRPASVFDVLFGELI